MVVVAHLQELGFARVAGGGGTREYRLSMGIADSHHRLVGNLGLFGLRHIAEDAARHGNRGASGSTAVDGQAVCRQAVGIVPSAVHQQFRSALAGVVAVDGQAVDGIGIVGVQVDGAGVGHIARDGGGAARCQGAAAVDGKPHGVACCVSARASGKCAIQRQLGALVELDDLPVDDGRAVGGGGHAIEVEGVDLAVGDRGVVTAIKHLRAVVLGGGNGQGVRASATLHAAEAGRAAPLHGVVAIATVDDSCDGGSSGHGERVVAFTADYAALDGAGLHGDDVIAQTAIDIAADAAGGVDGDGIAHVGGGTVVLALATAEHVTDDGGIAQHADRICATGTLDPVHAGAVLHDDGVIGRAAQRIGAGTGAAGGARSIGADAAQIPVVAGAVRQALVQVIVKAVDGNRGVVQKQEAAICRGSVDPDHLDAAGGDGPRAPRIEDGQIGSARGVAGHMDRVGGRGVIAEGGVHQHGAIVAGVVAVDGQAVDGIGIVGVQVDGAGVGHIARDGGGAARCQGAAAVDGKPHGVACCVSARASGKCAIQRQLGALVELDDLPVDDGRAVGGGGHAIEVEGVDLAVGDRGVVTAIKHLRAVVLGGGNGQGVRASATLHAAEAGRAAPLHGVVAIATVDDSCDGGSSGHGERVVAFTADYAALDGAGLHGDDVIAQTAIDIAADAAGGVDGDGVARVFGSAHVDPAASAQHIASH